MVDVRTLVVPKARADSMTLMKAELVKEGAKGVQRDIGPGGEGLYPCMGTAGVYVTEAATGFTSLNDEDHLIEEGWPGAAHTEGHAPRPHHEVVAKHTYTQAEMAKHTGGTLKNVGAGHILTDLAPSEAEFLHDGIANSEYDALRLTHDTGIVWIFDAPVHVLETQAIVYDEMGGAKMETGILSYSKDTTDGVDGTWTILAHHIVDISGVTTIMPDDAFAPAAPPLLTNIEGCKAIKIMGPRLAVSLVELNIWVPK